MPRLLVRRRAALLIILAFALASAPMPASGQVPAPGPVQVFRDIEYGKGGNKPLLLDAYMPAGRGSFRPAVLLLHGGGWRAGDKAAFAPEAERLAQQGWVAFSVNYRLDEPTAFPAAIEDVLTAVRWVRRNVAEFGVDAKRIGALGESAGGHLAAILATAGEGRLFTASRVMVAVAWSGPMDLVALGRARGEAWAVPLLGCSVTACPERFAAASPITFVDPTDAPLYLVNSTQEIVPLSQAEAMAEKLKAAGVTTRLDVLPGTRHSLDYREEVWPATLEFLRTQLEADTGAPGSQRSWTGTAMFVIAALAGAAVIGGGVGRAAKRTRRQRETVSVTS